MSDGLTWTKNYDLFTMIEENRDVKRHKNLLASMKEHGFLKCPIMCRRVNKKLVVQDGQHRLAVAKELGLAVCYVVEEAEIDIAKWQDTTRKWQAPDYVHRQIVLGNPHYKELAEFSEANGIPLTDSRALLQGLLGHGSQHIQTFREGKFVVTDRKYADRVARLYNALGSLQPAVRTSHMLGALMLYCLVPGLSDERLMQGARRRRELLVKYGSRDGFMTMIEELYNFGRTNKIGVKIAADNQARKRNPAYRNEYKVAR